MNKPNQLSTVKLVKLDKIKHAPDFFCLYPDYAKESNIDGLPFQVFYPKLLKAIETHSITVFTVLESTTEKTIGFIVFEKVFPFVVNAHIIVHPDHRNFYNAFNAGQEAIRKIFSKNIRQIIAYVKKDNLNARILLKKLGFYVWGKDEKCMAYSLIRKKRKG